MQKITINILADEDTLAEAQIQIMNNLIMLHAPSISAQWPINETGVQLSKQNETTVKLGFLHTRSDNYQSFYFDIGSYAAIEKFFKNWGFPMHQVINMDIRGG